MSNSRQNLLIYGDNYLSLSKYVLRKSVDLIYLDPPFNSQMNYGAVTKKNTSRNPETLTAFADTWHWNQEHLLVFKNLMCSSNEKLKIVLKGFQALLGETSEMAYLVHIASRVYLLHSTLKYSGSIYLHCAPNFSHYIKIIMDAVFGQKHFQNEIVWSYRTGGVSRKRWAKKHDTILYYSKSEQFKFHPSKEKSYVNSIRFTSEEQDYVKRLGLKRDKKGVYREVYPRDVWDINPVFRNSKGKFGYPTQKPKELLLKIITASSEIGDTVLDPYCGSGTTLEASSELKRKWIGIDNSDYAISVTKDRLLNQEVSYEFIKEKSVIEATDEIANEVVAPKRGRIRYVNSIYDNRTNIQNNIIKIKEIQ